MPPRCAVFRSGPGVGAQVANDSSRWSPESSGTGGHVGSEDVVRMAVKVLACSVVAHGGPRVGVPGCDLYVAQVDAGVEHGGDEGVPQHVGASAGVGRRPGPRAGVAAG